MLAMVRHQHARLPLRRQNDRENIYLMRTVPDGFPSSNEIDAVFSSLAPLAVQFVPKTSWRSIVAVGKKGEVLKQRVATTQSARL